MSFFLDSSILVAAITDIEPHSQASADLLLGKTALCIRSHALAETFSALTGGRLSLRLSPPTAVKLIEVNILPRVSITDLTAAEVLRALRETESRGIRGGSIHDYLHLATARKVKAARLYTLNPRHFQPLHRSGDPEVVHP